MDKNVRNIQTGLFSDIAYEALSSVIGQLADGYWENSNSMDKYWRFATIRRADNGEVLIEIDNREYIHEIYDTLNGRFITNFFRYKDETFIKNWFADKLKQIIKIEMKDNSTLGKWKRDNTNSSDYVGSSSQEVTVAQVYFIYEHLKGRNTNKYLAITRLKVVGDKLSDEVAARVAAKRKQYEDLAEKYTKDRAEVDAWEKAEIARIRKEAETKRSEIWTSYDKSRKELEK